MRVEREGSVGGVWGGGVRLRLGGWLEGSIRAVTSEGGGVSGGHLGGRGEGVGTCVLF